VVAVHPEGTYIPWASRTTLYPGNADRSIGAAGKY
jgi:hypothetical protein